MRPRPARRRGCLRAVAVVLALLTLPVPALAQQAGQLGFDMFGIGAAGTISPSMASGMVSSSMGLDALDLHSGHVHGGDVANPSSMDLAVNMDLAAQDMMAVDLNRIAEQARLEAERKRAAAEAEARKKGVALERRGDPGTPQEWELKNFSSCGSSANTSYRARIEMVELWEVLCRDAEAAGINLVLNSAFRDPRHQLRLYNDAIAKYGSSSAARKWVAWSDGNSCSSRHCSGDAVDISLSRSPGAQSWLHAPVGCAAPGQPDLSTTSCGSGQKTIKRIQLYGLIFPMSHEPWHAETGVVFNTAGAVGADCHPPASYGVPQIIASVWRCRLSEAGLDQATIDRTVAEALVVAKCESGWDPNIVIFGGKYVNTPHPSYGRRFTASGVWQWLESSANAWVEGGYANAKDPVKATDAAVRYWLSGWERGGRAAAWKPWACAVPVNDGVNIPHSVLPGFTGGPSKLPDWAWAY